MATSADTVKNNVFDISCQQERAAIDFFYKLCAQQMFDEVISNVIVEHNLDKQKEDEFTSF